MIASNFSQPPIRRIETLDQLDALIEASTDRPVWIFKHSLTCPVSSNAYREYRRFVEEQGGGVAGERVAPEAAAGSSAGSSTGTVFALVEIQNARPVSNAIAERTGVTHQSPQALLLRDAAVAWHASHWNIEAPALQRAAGS